jgi:hypothetical protein
MVPMIPAPSTKVIEFLEWVRKNRPDLASFTVFTKKEFFTLAHAFEKSRGRAISKKAIVSQYLPLMKEWAELSKNASLDLVK